MSAGIFIAGTDTDVGKTLVAAGILRSLRGMGIDAAPMKPAQTGAVRKDGRLVAPDLEFCLAASGIRPGAGERELMSPYLYEPACSPHLAGRMAHRYVDLAEIKACVERLLKNRQALVVEGAGGIMAPINEGALMLDLMKALAYPVVLVARSGLGTISHTLLSIAALRQAGLRIVGVVFSRPVQPLAEDRVFEEENPPAVARFGEVRVLGRLRHLDGAALEGEEMWRHFGEDMTGMEYIFNELKECDVSGRKSGRA